MNWWLVADVLGMVVFLPALLVFLGRLERPLARTRDHLRRIVEDCDRITGTLDGIPGLAETQLLTSSGKPGVVRYAEALDSAHLVGREADL